MPETEEAMPGTPVSGGSGSQPAGFESQPATALGEVRELIRGNAGAILFVVLACLSTAAVYLWFAPPRYVARATLLVDPASSSMPEEYYIESQTQLMRSDPIVRAVIGQFDPADIVQDDKTFILDQARTVKGLLGEFLPTTASSAQDADPVQDAVSTLRRNLAITRPAMTPVIHLAYDATDPRRAADIINTLIQVYMSHRQRDGTTSAQQSVAWLAQRLDVLRQQVDKSEDAMEDFKAANTIVGTGANHSLKAEQRLYELDMLLQAARAGAGQTRIQDETTSKANEREGDVSPRELIAGNEFAMLSGRQLAAGRAAESDSGIRTDFLHPAISIDGGSSGSLGNTRNEGTTELPATVAQLEKAFAEAAAEAAEAGRQRSRLRQLETSAEMYRTLHANMLQRYEEAVQQSSLPSSNSVQVLIAARQPDSRSHPRPLLVFAFAGVFGIALGIGVAVARRGSSQSGVSVTSLRH